MFSRSHPCLRREVWSIFGCITESHCCFACFYAVAMKAMNKVASHINEMQKLHEEYGAVFDLLISEQTADKKEVEVSSPSLSYMNPVGILRT